MAQIKFANNVSTQLAKPITKDSTTIEVRSLTLGLTWPELTSQGDYFLIVIDDLDTSRWEILKCTNVEIRSNGTVLTVERGLEGTVAADFNAGAVVENRLTAGTINNFATGLPDIVPLTRGGTQADNPVDARTNLEIYSKTEVDAKETALQEQIKSSMPPDASTTVKGIVQLSNAVDSDSEILAATSKAVKTAYDTAVAASKKSDSADKLVTPRSIILSGKASGSADFDGSTDITINVDVVSASTTKAGITQLSNAINSDSETTAATSKAVKTLAGNIGAISTVPKGGIISFSGTFGGEGNRFPIPLGESTEDTQWCLCDGIETNGYQVPDLRGRMILGVNSTYTLGSTGGAVSHQHTVDGNVDGTTITVEQLAGHTHLAATRLINVQAQVNQNQLSIGTHLSNCSNYGSGIQDMFNTGIQYTGGWQAHAHTFSTNSHSTTTLPPYYALAYIMRIA